MKRDIQKLIDAIKERLGEVPQFFFRSGVDDLEHLFEMDGVDVYYEPSYVYIEIYGLTDEEQAEFCKIVGYDEGITEAMIKMKEENEARKRARKESLKGFCFEKISKEMEARIQEVAAEYGVAFVIHGWEMEHGYGQTLIKFNSVMRSTSTHMQNKYIEKSSKS